MSDERRDGSSARRAILRVASGLLLAIAVAGATYPWWTGLYTRFEQRRLRAAEERIVPRPAPRPSETSPPEQRRPFDGWEVEDRAYWRRLEAGGRFGRLVIPAADVDAMVVKGDAKDDLKRGPGWVDGTDLPGPTGNAVIAGHRTTYLAPFRHIDRLKPGDRIDFHSPFRVYRYEVVRRSIVRPSEKSVTQPTREPMLTLSACHPPYRATHRIIVQARLVAVGTRVP